MEENFKSARRTTPKSEVPVSGRIRPLRADDLDRAIALDAQYAMRSRKGFFEKRLAAVLSEPDRFIFVGHEDRRGLNGFALAHLLEGEFGHKMPVAMLDSIAVDIAVRGQGTGRLLLAEVERILLHKGVASIETETDWRNASLVQFLSSAGFLVAPRIVLEYDLSKPQRELSAEGKNPSEEWMEKDFSDPHGDDFSALSRDRFPCRSMRADDLEAIVAIARHADGVDRSAYYRRKMKESLVESGIRISLVSEMDGRISGFIMARMDFGEFGRVEPAAVIDSIGVSREHTHEGIGTALLSQLIGNLSFLRGDTVRTVVSWDQENLLAFFRENGFAPSQSLIFSRPIF